MADSRLAKWSEWAGIGAAALTVIAFGYYLYTKGGSTINGVRFNRTSQPNRDSRLGKAQGRRKYFGSIARSSATGAGTAAQLPNRIGKYGSSRVQRNNTRMGSPTNGQVSTNSQTTVSSRKNITRRPNVAAVAATSSN